MSENKKTILENALLEYEEIKKAAEAKLAAELPEKFQNILKEELNKNNNKSVNESYKKVDDKKTEINEDSEMKNDKETKQVNEDFNLEELDMPNVDSALDGMADDDIVSIDEIEKVLSELEAPEETPEELPKETPEELPAEEINPTDKISNLKSKLEEILSEIDNMNVGDENLPAEDLPSEELGGEEMPPEEMSPEGLDGEEFIDAEEINLDELDSMLSEFDISDLPDDGELGGLEGNGEEEEIEEAQTMTYGHNRGVTGDHLPGKGYSDHKDPQKRPGSFNNESVDKKYNAVLESNKNLIKKVNEMKKYKKEVSTLLENYKNVLTKYRTQLKEMSIYNTNLSNVNNLLVNETLALTQDDKIKIIKEFKSIKTINESKEKYTSLLNDLKSSSSKRIDESVTEKITDSIQPSSKNKLDEVIESTAYENDEHVNRMKEVINLLESRDKKKTL